MNKDKQNMLWITEERLMDDASNITEGSIKKTHKEILKNFNVSETLKKDSDIIENIIRIKYTNLPPITWHLKHREYLPELEDALYDIDYFYEKEDNGRGIIAINDVIKKHKSKLTRDDYIMLSLKKARMLNSIQKIKTSMETLQEISVYEKYFNQDDKNIYYLIKGCNLYYQGTDIDKVDPEKAVIYFLNARDAFTTLINQKTFLENNRYKTLMLRSALCYYKLNHFNKADVLLSKIRNIPNDIEDISLNAQILYLHGSVYKKLKQHQKAIDAFREYLQYEPKDEETKKLIRILSEQPPE